jgi:predicted MFS family arabinose efflux permease
MLPPHFRPLFAAACGAHAADQLALAALPLTAALALDAGHGTVGLLVAAQASAWMLVSLPGGVWIDRVARRSMLAGSQVVSAAALLLATSAAFVGITPLLGLAAFLAASGTVLFVLTATSAMPDLVGPEDLPAANARVELARAVMTLVAPIAVGWMAASATPTLGYALATLAAIAGAIAALRLPRGEPIIAAARPPLTTALVEGARFVLAQPLLRGIGLCAVFWNFAFFALVAVCVPYGLGVVGLDPREIGLAQAAAGIGGIAGSLSAAAVLRHFAPRVVLLAGPGVSVIAAALLLVAAPLQSVAAAAAGFALIGFGPMLWLICQQSLRQLVTPRPLLGRVNATIQLAIYGVRPLGALTGGVVAAGFGPAAAVWLVAGLFLASFLVPAFGALGKLAAMPAPVPANAR